MNVISVNKVDRETEITVESGFWIFKKNTTYRTYGKPIGRFYKWVKLPNMSIIGDRMSFQLDTWKELNDK